MRDAQIKQALGAVLEVLSGADHPRVLQLAEHIAAGKMLLTGVLSGTLVVTERAPDGDGAKQVSR